MDLLSWLLLIWVGTIACFVADERVAAFYLIDSDSPEGSICASFQTLKAALEASSSQPTATVSLMTQAELPSWAVSNTLTLLGNGNVLALVGTVIVTGSLTVMNAHLIPQALQDFALIVSGALELTNCVITDFPSPPLLVRGQVSATNTTFEGNSQGVFSLLALGGRLTVSNSRFLNNAGTAGAVFSMYPTSGSGQTQYLISDCLFQRNGKKVGSSVLVVNDLGVTSLSVQSITFSRCNFTGHAASTFKITSHIFNLNVSECDFDRETQLVEATLFGTYVSLSKVVVSKSAGPLFVLYFAGLFNLTACNFTDISTGPLVVALGEGISVSLVFLRQIRLVNISNWNAITYGNLINAFKASVWMESILLDQFGGKLGAFSIVACLFFSKDLTAARATTNGNGVGIIAFSTIAMNDTLIDAVNSGGSMWLLYQSSGSIKRITYQEIRGLWIPELQVYSTNLFIINVNANIEIEDIDIKFEYAGTPLFFIRDGNVTMTNLQFTGQLAYALIAAQNSVAVLREFNLRITWAYMIAFETMNAYMDFDRLSLQDMSSISPLLSLSSGSSIHIQHLSLVNVTIPGLCKGSLYTMAVDTADIDRSAIEALIYFSSSVKVKLSNLTAKNTQMSLFYAFNSDLALTQATLANVTVAHTFLYLVHSNVTLSSAALNDIQLAGVGGLARALSQTSLILTTVSMANVAGIEHGVLNLESSALMIASSSFVRFNISLIVAQRAYISIIDTEVSDVLLGSLRTMLSMVPNGGLLSCLNCPSIVVSGTRCRDVSAKNGGIFSVVVSELGSSGTLSVEGSYFDHCAARGAGGVIFTENYTVLVSHCTFKNNVAVNGGVVSFVGSETLSISKSVFVGNLAFLAGSCVQWVGHYPTLHSNDYLNNSAVYGNPLASTPHHLLLLDPQSLQPITQFPIQGVTGQRMNQSLLVGVFDIYQQLITTENATFISLNLPAGISCIGSTQAISVMGIATFSLLLYPFSISTHDFSFRAPNIDNLTCPFHFRDCYPGETRSPSGCFSCPKNSYSLNPSDSLCRTCPAHIQCHGQDILLLEKDYWRTNTLTDVIYPCLVLDSCLGGFNSTCASGYEGALCSSCSHGYYRLAGWMCCSCESEVPAPARGVAIALSLVSIAILLPQLFLVEEGLGFRAALSFRIFQQHAQVLMLTGLLHAQWGLNTLVYYETMRALASLGGLWMFADCQYESTGLEQHYFRLIAASFYPLVFLPACAVVWAFIRCRQGRGEVLPNVLASWGVLVYHYCPVMCLLVVSMLQCQDVGGEQLLVAEMTQKCWTGAHLKYFFTVIVPLVVWLFVCHGIAFVCIVRPPSLKACRLAHTYLTAGFKTKQAGWEIRMSICRIGMAVLSISFSVIDNFSSAIVFSCIIGYTIQSHVKWTPHKQLIHDIMTVAGQLTAVVAMFSAVQGGDALVLTLVCFGTCSVLALGVLGLKKPNAHQVTTLVNRENCWSSQIQPAIYPELSAEESQSSLKPPPPSVASEMSYLQ